MLLVALRVGLGFHFFYEGVWKIKHADEFTAEPFLSQAKGPIAPLFYAMLPDINGRQRLQRDLKFERISLKQLESEAGKGLVDSLFGAKADRNRKIVVGRQPVVAARWEALRQRFVDHFGATAPGARSPGDAGGPKNIDLDAASRRVLAERLGELAIYLGEHQQAIAAYFDALDRFEQDPQRNDATDFQKQRRWDTMQQLRAEAAEWFRQIEGREKTLEDSLYRLIDTEFVSVKGRVPASWNPLRWSRIEQINFAVTWALTAIGLCLLLGLCTRPAALGGAAFMLFVVMTQPAWPTIYPPDPAVVGHALLVNKDFIEMLALLVVASTAVGRWAGLDYFLGTLVVDPMLSKTLRKKEG